MFPIFSERVWSRMFGRGAGLGMLALSHSHKITAPSSALSFLSFSWVFFDDLSSHSPWSNTCFNSVFFFLMPIKRKRSPHLREPNTTTIDWFFFKGIAINPHTSPFICRLLRKYSNDIPMNAKLLTLEACWWELHDFYKKVNDIPPKAEHFLFLIDYSKFDPSEMQEKCQQCQKGVGRAMETAALRCESKKRHFLSRNWACGSCKR